MSAESINEHGPMGPSVMVMPFVVCASTGGPYDDDAFAAGWHAAQIDVSLAAIAAVGGSGMVATVRTDLLRQLDLIAMRHGFVVAVTPVDGMPEWVQWRAHHHTSPTDELHH